MVELLMHTLMLDNEMLRHMSGAILSEIYGAALIMMRSQLLIEMPGCQNNISIQGIALRLGWTG